MKRRPRLSKRSSEERLLSQTLGPKAKGTFQKTDEQDPHFPFKSFCCYSPFHDSLLYFVVPRFHLSPFLSVAPSFSSRSSLLHIPSLSLSVVFFLSVSLSFSVFFSLSLSLILYVCLTCMCICFSLSLSLYIYICLSICLSFLSFSHSACLSYPSVLSLYRAYFLILQ